MNFVAKINKLELKLQKATRKIKRLRKKPWLTKVILVSTKTKEHISVESKKDPNDSELCLFNKKYRNKLTRKIEQSKLM